MDVLSIESIFYPEYSRVIAVRCCTPCGVKEQAINKKNIQEVGH